MPVSATYRAAAPTVSAGGKTDAYPIKSGDRTKLRSAIRLYNMHKNKYSTAERQRIVAHIRRAARKMGIDVNL